MQITSRPVRRGGFALIITMIFLGVALLIFASMMYWVSGNAKITGRNNQYNMSSSAAEAAVERVLAQMDRDFNSQSLTTAAYYATLPVDQTAWPVSYNYSDPTGATTNAIYVNMPTPSTNAVALNSQYAGLTGYAQYCTISAKATPNLSTGSSVYNVPATVTETVDFASIPIFQFAIFYNINLEIAPGQAMTIAGPVFCNQGIWAGASDTTFSSTVTAVGTNVNTSADDPFALNYSKDGGPTFTVAGQPSVQADSLVMPIGTNNDPNAVHAIIQLPPPAFALGTAAGYSTNGQTYLANAADLYITNTANGINTNAPAGTNTFVYLSDGSLKPVPPDYYILKGPINFATNWVYTNLNSGGSIGSSTNYAGNVRFAGYSFLTNVLFYDWREGWNGGSGIGGKGKAVQAVQFDVAKFYTWATNGVATNGGAAFDTSEELHSGHHIDSVYIYNGVAASSTVLPAVRVANGIKLPIYGTTKNGFTLVTQFPLYVLGDYNAKDNSGYATNQYGSLAATASYLPGRAHG